MCELGFVEFYPQEVARNNGLRLRSSPTGYTPRQPQKKRFAVAAPRFWQYFIVWTINGTASFSDFLRSVSSLRTRLRYSKLLISSS